MLIADDFEVKISMPSDSFETYTVPPSHWSTCRFGALPRICIAKLLDLMTSMEETRLSTMMFVLTHSLRETALILPLIWIVVFLQRKMKTEWLISTSSRVNACSFS